MSDNRFKIKTDARTTFVVLEYQLFKKRWIDHFGGVDKVKEFIKNYK